MSRNDLLNKIEQMTGSAETLAVYGSPRSGKTRFLLTLKQQLLTHDHTCVVFGPLRAPEMLDESVFNRQLFDWLRAEEVVAPIADADVVLRSASPSIFWNRLLPYVDPAIQRVVILLDDVDAGPLSTDDLYALFGRMRKFTTEWSGTRFAIISVLAGTWSPLLLQAAFKQRQSSWLFPPEGTLFRLPDLDETEILTWLQEVLDPDSVRTIHAQYLHELSAGDVSAIQHVLSGMTTNMSSCDAIRDSAAAVVQSGEFLAEVTQRLEMCNPQAHRLLALLLNGQALAYDRESTAQSDLIRSGLARIESIESSAIVILRNWLIESALRRHRARLHRLLTEPYYENVDELMPPIRCLNRRAYEIICEIENLLRNLVMCRLGLTGSRLHPLRGVGGRRKQFVDQYARSSEWRKSFAGKAHVAPYAALIGYSRTSDLLDLVSHLTAQHDPIVIRLDAAVQRRLSDLKDIRDVVMHNQVLSEHSYNILCEIREDVYRALSQDLSA